MSVSEVITLVNGSKITSAQRRGSDYLGHKYKLIGAGCSNQKQLTQGHSHSHDFANVQADYGTLLHPTPTCVHDGLNPLQLALARSVYI